ncbi:hypothetical protein [Hymenobacter canadensis]|uniref:DNA-directed DNA polymerase family A palm domain-containing protein n=1 Tax=Hymenobacter canadensis TaxID=2999067 RepID=A0ABY7LT72_9BACT|nr:hypothetical protein [Hymenobacter canadensis]WBA43181.1 hypothetical protein O3303_06350 [Hymenobacter canadensis]
MIQQQFAVPGKIDIPLILDSIDFTREYGGQFAHIEKNKQRYINDHQDKYHYFLHKIIEAGVFNKTLGPLGFASLSMKTLCQMLGSRYAKEVKDVLLAAGIIQSDNQYIVGQKSIGYRIHPDWMSRSVLREVFNPHIMGKKLEQQRVQYQSQQQADSTWKNLNLIGINKQEALRHIEEKLNSSLSALLSYDYTLAHITTSKQLTKKVYEPIFLAYTSNPALYSLMIIHLLRKATSHKQSEGLNALQLVKASLLSQYEADRMAIEKIAKGDFFLEQPDKTSRIFTNISNLSSDLRQFLFHQQSESRLINLDIRNSQPYIFSLLLADAYRGEELPADVQEYIRLTSSGTFYNVLMDDLGYPQEQRSAFKVKFFASIFFCKSEHSAGQPFGRYFAQRFPNVYKQVEHHKERDYSDLAILMQRREASVILGKISAKLTASGIFHATIHDSVVVLEEHTEKVRKMMMDGFRDEIGTSPTIESDLLSTSLDCVKSNEWIIDQLFGETMGSEIAW